MPAGPTVDDLVEAIRDEPIYDVLRTEHVKVGGADGVHLEVRVSSTYDASQCERGIGLPGNPGTSVDFRPRYHGNWWILDVDGQRVVIQQNCHCNAAALEHAAAIPRSITFTPTS